MNIHPSIRDEYEDYFLEVKNGTMTFEGNLTLDVSGNLDIQTHSVEMVEGELYLNGSKDPVFFNTYSRQGRQHVVASGNAVSVFFPDQGLIGKKAQKLQI